MAKDGKKLELYEILAAKRAKGTIPLGMDAKNVKQANSPEPEPVITDAPGIIIDDAVSAEVNLPPPAPLPTIAVEPQLEPEPEPQQQKPVVAPPPAAEVRPRSVPQAVPVAELAPPPEPRPKSPREVVFSLDFAFICFTGAILMLVASSYFIGYKRGQEERPAGLAAASEIEVMDPQRINIRYLSPPPRAAMQPPPQDYTLILRKEPVSDDPPERLELELAEALMRGKKEIGRDSPGFIFRTNGADPQYILAVGVGATANDQELNTLLKIYNDMEGITLSRQPRPYLGCRIAPIRELGSSVY